MNCKPCEKRLREIGPGQVAVKQECGCTGVFTRHDATKSDADIAEYVARAWPLCRECRFRRDSEVDLAYCEGIGVTELKGTERQVRFAARIVAKAHRLGTLRDEDLAHDEAVYFIDHAELLGWRIPASAAA